MKSSSASFQAFRFDQFPKRLEPGTFILIPYILIFAWQYAGAIRNKTLAWTVAAIICAIVWYLYVSFTDPVKEKLPNQFWLLVALPLLLIYSLRVIFPDISFDVLDYHIFQGERVLRGPLFRPGDFFPTPAPFNPSPDILTGLYRHALGYRLGTAVNYFALIWTGMILSRLLRDYLASAWLRCAAVLLVLLTEQLLFQINNYMVDLLALPLLLEATRLAIYLKPGGETSRTIRIAFLLGGAIAFKLANLAFLIPILMVYVFNLFVGVDRDKLQHRILRFSKIAPAAVLAFVMPSLPFTYVIYRFTGSPIFPFYNGIFKSPYWSQGAAFDPRWGPHGLFETIAWPVVMFFRPERLCEFTAYSGRLSIGFVLAAICVVIARRDREIRSIAFITLLGSILWSASSGYIRYALYLELTSGVVLIWLVRFLWRRCAQLSGWKKWAPQIPLWLLLASQCFFALGYVYAWEWSNRETILASSHVFRKAKDLFRDRSLRTYLDASDRSILDDVEVWFETTYKTTALEVLLKTDVPIIGVREFHHFDTNAARQKFAEALEAARGKRMFTLTDRSSLDSARQALAARGLRTGETRAVSIYYFSRTLKFDMLLMEVLPAWQNDSGQMMPAAKDLPLPDIAFKARLSVADVPTTFNAGQKYLIRVILRNESRAIWPGGQPRWQYQITVGNRWLTENGAKVNDVDGRVALFDDLAPSASVELPLTISAPNEPGIYILQLDAIQEGVAWFGDRGSEILALKVKVE